MITLTIQLMDDGAGFVDVTCRHVQDEPTELEISAERDFNVALLSGPMAEFPTKIGPAFQSLLRR